MTTTYLVDIASAGKYHHALQNENAMRRHCLDDAELRRRAEFKMSRNDLPSKHAMDPLRTLHELEVHKVELQLQNDELMAANLELDIVRLKYQSFYDKAPVGCLTLSATGEVLDFNDCAGRMLKFAPSQLQGASLRDVFISECRLQFDALLASALCGALARSSDPLVLPRAGGVPLYVTIQAERVDDLPSLPQKVLVFLMDVTSLKLATDDVLGLLPK